MPNELKIGDSNQCLTIRPENYGGGFNSAPFQIREYIRASKADNTLRGYQSDWRDFCAWCESRGRLSPLPATPDTVAVYIAECARHLKPGSIQRG